MSLEGLKAWAMVRLSTLHDQMVQSQEIDLVIEPHQDLDTAMGDLHSMTGHAIVVPSYHLPATLGHRVRLRQVPRINESPSLDIQPQISMSNRHELQTNTKSDATSNTLLGQTYQITTPMSAISIPTCPSMISAFSTLTAFRRARRRMERLIHRTCSS